jgi:hypothetical protein
MDHSSNMHEHVITVSLHMTLDTIVEIEDESKEDKPIDVCIDIKFAMNILSPSRTSRLEDTPNASSILTKHECTLLTYTDMDHNSSNDHCNSPKVD